MTKVDKTKRSLYLLLGVLIVATVVLVLGLQGTYSYLTKKQQIVDRMKQDATMSAAILQKNIVTLIEAYAINEYSKLVTTEVKLREHFAIIIKDNNMGTIVGEEVFTSGAIRDPSGTVIEFDANNPVHHRWLQNNLYQNEVPVISTSGTPLGSITIYMDDITMKQKLKDILLQSISGTLFISLLLIVLLIVAIQRIIVRPLAKIAFIIEQSGRDGIPTTNIPDSPYGEISILTDTMNDMRLRLGKSRKELQSANNQLEERVNTRTQELLEANQLLQKSEEKFRFVSENLQEGLWTTDSEDRMTFCNKRMEEISGVTREDVIGLSIMEDFPEETTQHFLPFYLKAKQQLKPISYETNVVTPGKEKTVQAGWLIPKINNGKYDGIVCTIDDISERIKSEQEIRLLSKAVEQSPVSIIITDADAKIEYVNSAFEKVTGYGLEEVVGKNPRLLKSGNTPSGIYKELWQTITQGKTKDCELQNRKKNGEIFWENAHFSSVKNSKGIITHYLALKEDITDRKIQEEKILHQAHFDALTDLPNRFLSLDRLSQLLIETERNKKQVAVLFIDLDDFKKVNDSLGHDVGDNLLIKTAGRLSSVIRSGDTVGRLGGDEFIVLLSGLDKASDAQPIAENLLEKFREPFIIDNRELIITASIGISIFPDDGTDASELLRNADSAMYHSKDLGRNAYSYFTDAMNQNISRRLSLEEQLIGALDRNEFSVFYQPKIDMATSQIMGAEALLRWSNPALGDIPPDEFIPIAEQSEVIISLGEYVLKEALEKTAQWQKQYLPEFQIAVNVSPRQFRDLGFVSFIAAAISDAGIRGDHLELEITEGVLMGSYCYIDDALDEINNLHVSIAMDDFGTGYSSLSYLRSYPFNVLKIDRSFVNDISVDIADRELTNAAIAMAHGLNLKVVAEGIETEEQLAILQNLNCDYGQGYLFSKPISAEKFTELMKVRESNP